jgi:hypothetical protein
LRLEMAVVMGINEDCLSPPESGEWWTIGKKIVRPLPDMLIT